MNEAQIKQSVKKKIPNKDDDGVPAHIQYFRYIDKDVDGGI